MHASITLIFADFSLPTYVNIIALLPAGDAALFRYRCPSRLTASSASDARQLDFTPSLAAFSNPAFNAPGDRLGRIE
jgi:hypothetical protein